MSTDNHNDELLNNSNNSHNNDNNNELLNNDNNKPIEAEAIEINENVNTKIESEQAEASEQVVTNEQATTSEQTATNEQTVVSEQATTSEQTAANEQTIISEQATTSEQTAANEQTIVSEQATANEQASTLERQAARNEEKQKKRKAYSPLVAGFLGAIIGSSTMLGGVWFLDNKGTSGTATGGSSNAPQEITVTNISSDDVTGVIEEAQRSVVGVVNYQYASNNVNSIFGGQGQEEAKGELKAAGSGSGIVYKKSGDKAYVVTNHHVIENADSIEITLSDGKTLKAKLVGSDEWSDLAVLEVDGSSIENVASLGDSDQLLAGQSVIAIGNPLGYLDGTVTQGIISSAERSIDVDINNDGVADWAMTVIQTDAAINPGNSGGALLNANGDVIGINSSKIADTSVEGIGFAIPMNSAMPILEQLEEKGEVTRPQMGASLVDLSQVSSNDRTSVLNLPSDVTTGVVVASVTEGSPAASAGLKMYDVITAIDDKEVESTADIRKYLFTEKEVGDKITVTYYRDGKEQKATLTLAAAKNN